MSKEEAIRKSVPSDCIWDEGFPEFNLTNTPVKYVYEAMDEYAKSLAIGFGEWKDAHGYRRERGRKNKERVYGKWYVPAAGYGGGEPIMHTSDELFSLYMEELNVTPLWKGIKY